MASTLVFTLKSQASAILPKIASPISSIYDHAGDAQQGSFNSDFKDAQRDNEETGTWGTAQYYIDKNNNMYIGPGRLQNDLYDTIGGPATRTIQNVNFTNDVQAPSDSTRLFANANQVQHINGIEHLDTSLVTTMSNMFANDHQLNDVDLSHWDTSHVDDMTAMFSANLSLSHLSLGHWDTSHVTGMSYMFYGDNLTQLDLNGWDTSQVNDMSNMFSGNHALSQVNVKGWNTANLKNANSMFSNDDSLPSVDLSGWQTSQAQNLDYMFDSDAQLQDLNLRDIDTTNASMSGFLIYTSNKLRQINLGSKTYLKDHLNMADGNWQNGSQTLSSQQILDGHSHPGTWVKQ